MVPVFTRAAARRVDALCTETFGLPTIVLMENAAVHLAAAAMGQLGRGRRAGVVIVCGPGNNGGDGLAAARHLHNAGLHPMIVMSHGPDAVRGDARVHLGVCVRMGLPMVQASEHDAQATLALVAEHAALAAPRPGRQPGVVIDALFGTGLDRPVRRGTVAACLIEGMNTLRRQGWRVVAADIPSGLDADRGTPMCEAADGRRTAVRAHVTVTFAGMKRGFAIPQARPFVGRVEVADIGAPAALLRRLGRAGNG